METNKSIESAEFMLINTTAKLLFSNISFHDITYGDFLAIKDQLEHQKDSNEFIGYTLIINGIII